MDLLNSIFLYKQTTIFHLICKNNHIHLYDLIQKHYKEAVDINLENEIGETPLMVSLNEKNQELAEKIIKEFRDSIEFEDDYM
jgi:ankyrin repeat protein